jgi:hypothetical protein
MSRLTAALRIRTVPAIAIWSVAVGLGLFWMMEYETTPGAFGAQQGVWPDRSGIQRKGGLANLVMFAHPRCPCTRASLNELAQIMTDCQGLVTAEVLFLKPPGTGKDWDTTDLWEKARSIPGVEVRADTDGRERKQFGIETSGHVVLYDPNGKRIFSGGITGSRGQVGENAGRSAIVQLIRDSGLAPLETPVFGCSLADR